MLPIRSVAVAVAAVIALLSVLAYWIFGAHDERGLARETSEHWSVPGVAPVAKPEGGCPPTLGLGEFVSFPFPEASRAKNMFFDADLTRHGAVGPQGGYTYGEEPKTISVLVRTDGVVSQGAYEFHLMAESFVTRWQAHNDMRESFARLRKERGVGMIGLCLKATREVPWQAMRGILRANAHALGDVGKMAPIGQPTEIQVQVAGSVHHWDRRMLLLASFEEGWDWDWDNVLDLDEDEVAGGPEDGEGRYVIHLRREETASGPMTRIKIRDAVFDFPVGDAFEDSAFVGASNRVWTRVAESLREEPLPAQVELSLRSGLTTPWAYVVKVLDLLNLAGVRGVFLPISGAEEVRTNSALRDSLPAGDTWTHPLKKPMVLMPTCLYIEFVALPPPLPLPRCGPEAEPNSKSWTLVLGLGLGLCLTLALSSLLARRRRRH